ncbi:RUN and FYVE domain-containing protein 1-like [Patagioenas fasciata monilis]|uniref:RUN and FYVE domain-containing protein 1-like n=1 Tax=Patagioenas fasciata monilis TaxID=372326 RepID=A0A1V4L077_PATFA|nr:RUN and FYVE domain-containing protein 1-like [Patagioenas fasciata monilis]
MAFVFYHKFMWLKSRLRQAEKDRQLAQQDNRLFKQEFGDKINSLQLQVEELSRQRSHLELELKRERDRWSPCHQRIQENKQGAKAWLRADGKLKIHEENAKPKQPPRGENSVLPPRSPSSTQEEQEQPPGRGSAEVCQLCQEESSRSQEKNVCKNCGGVFCGACSAHELPLPSSINPERVCDRCHERLMQHLRKQNGSVFNPHVWLHLKRHRPFPVALDNLAPPRCSGQIERKARCNQNVFHLHEI